jgi:hypothetical protein
VSKFIPTNYEIDPRIIIPASGCHPEVGKFSKVLKSLP